MKHHEHILRFPGEQVCARILPQQPKHADATGPRDYDRLMFEATCKRTGERYQIQGRFLRAVLWKHFERPDWIIQRMLIDNGYCAEIPSYRYRAPRARIEPGVA